jgi:hypothetical protein
MPIESNAQVEPPAVAWAGIRQFQKNHCPKLTAAVNQQQHKTSQFVELPKLFQFDIHNLGTIEKLEKPKPETRCLERRQRVSGLWYVVR